MKSSIFFTLIGLFSLTISAQNLAPFFSNVSAGFETATNEVIVSFHLHDNEGDNVDVKLLVSDDGGENFLVNAASAQGDVGFPITPGNNKEIRWNIGSVSNILNYTIRLVADDRQTPGIADLVAQVDSNRLRSDLELIAGIRHYQANPTHLEAVKDTIESRFVNVGLQTRRQEVIRDGYTGHNIIGRLQGLGNEEITFIIDGHFDTVNDSPGADDNGSAVAGVLEALRVLSPLHFEKSITFIGFDFEEVVGFAGTNGSFDYVQSGMLPSETVEGVLNFEMIGYFTQEANSQQIPSVFDVFFPNQSAALEADSFRGNFITNVGDTESDALVAAYDSAIARYVPELKSIALVVTGNGLLAPDLRRSDHAHFWDQDIAALMLTDGANFRNPNYHTPFDTVGALSFTFMSQVVAASVATLAELAGWQNSTFSDVGILPASVASSKLKCKIEIAPNPVSENITVEWRDCFADLINLKLYSSNGRLVKTQSITTSPKKMNIDVSFLEKGVYLLVLEGRDRVGVEGFVVGG